MAQKLWPDPSEPGPDPVTTAITAAVIIGGFALLFMTTSLIRGAAAVIWYWVAG